MSPLAENVSTDPPHSAFVQDEFLLKLPPGIEMFKVEVLFQNTWSSFSFAPWGAGPERGGVSPHSQFLSHSWENWESGLLAPRLVTSDTRWPDSWNPSSRGVPSSWTSLSHLVWRLHEG